jgi:hypothetical protein
MATRRSVLLPVLFLVIGALLAVVAILIGSRVFSSNISIHSAGPTIKQVQELADLIVLRVQIADVLYNDDDSGAKMAMLVRGDCDLIVDLNEARILESDSVTHHATIQLPLPKVARPRVDHERTKIYKIEKTGIMRFVPWRDPRGPLYEESMKEAQRIIEFHSSKDEEQQRAQRQAESVITVFFDQLDWDVEIEWKDE